MSEVSCQKHEMPPKVVRINEIGFIELGEGPHWDVKQQCLYFVDIFGKAIHKYVPSTKAHTKAFLEKHVSFIIPVEGQSNRFVIGLGREVAIVTWDGQSESVSKIENLVEVDKDFDIRDNRFNDGKCDASGRLWAGTMGEEPVNGHVKPNKGSFYSVAPNKHITTHLTQVGISNGLAWSHDHKKFYYIDTSLGSIQEFDFDIKSGTISNGKAIFTLSKHGDGALDGMTIDTDGNLWIAIFNGYRVIKIDPRKQDSLLDTIPIPAKQVTSVTFGGPNLDLLYVTSAGFTVDGVKLNPPDHGAVYVVSDLEGARGLPAANFRV